MTVAALYVDPKGVYAGLPDVEVWDEARDARTYAGPWPVVAHPPCNRWCVLAPLNESLHADRLGDSYRVGEDGGCFAAALAAVREWGGVLEHPAQSLAWDRFALPHPGTHGWTSSLLDPGLTTEVAQSAYGLPARKRTWLYAVGCELPALDWREPPVTAQVSAFRLGRAGRAPVDAMPRHETHLTPSTFRDVLLDMARSVVVRYDPLEVVVGCEDCGGYRAAGDARCSNCSLPAALPA